MSNNLQHGWLAQAHRIPSENCDSRPAGAQISLLVIHGISLPPGEFGGPWIDRLFTNQLDPHQHPYFEQICDFKVSSHFLIRRDGQLNQYVPIHKRAWHAGVSCYQGRDCCNDFSIGIELEGEDHLPYEDIQYQVLSDLVKSLMEHCPTLSREKIVGHSDIAPGRKTDPGPAFDWGILQKGLE